MQEKVANTTPAAPLKLDVSCLLYTSMQHFQQDIFDAEEHLQAARRLYNSNAVSYTHLDVYKRQVHDSVPYAPD